MLNKNTVCSQESYSQFTSPLGIFDICLNDEILLFLQITTHHPTYALHVNTDKYTPRDTRQLDYISQFTSDIRYIKGSDNIVADALSCSSIKSIDSETLTFYLTTNEQQADASLDKIEEDTSYNGICLTLSQSCGVTIYTVSTALYLSLLRVLVACLTIPCLF